MNLATPSSKKIVYSKTSNAWPATSPVDYEATTLAEGTLSGDSKVNTSVNGTNFDRDVLSSYYFTGTNNTTATHDFIFYCGLTGVTSVMVSLAGTTTGMEISYNTFPSEDDISLSSVISQGVLTSGVVTTLDKTTANFIGLLVTVPSEGTLNIESITLTWSC